MTGINLDPHDECTFPQGESLVGKQFRLVTINTKGEVVLAKEGEPAFCLLSEAEGTVGESVTVAVPLQVKAVAGEEIKPGWKLKVNAEGKLVKASEEKHVIGIALSGGKTGALISYTSTPCGCTG
jgi:hypothetical protein